MREFIGELSRRLGPLLANERIGPGHIAVYVVLLKCSEGRAGWFGILPAQIMNAAKVKDTTYYRVMRELENYGIIEYWASRCWKNGSRIRIVQCGHQ